MQHRLRLVFGLAFALFLFDFSVFYSRTLSAKKAEAPSQSDGIIVLTGSAKRLDVAVNLLDAGLGKRLLISGVHPDVKPGELQALVGGSDDKWACCIDLDRAAETTTGNAIEAKRWADAKSYQSLIVVTADYHMPRSLIEFRRAMPDRQIRPVKVESADSALEALIDLGLVRRVFSEWLKWRVTQLRRGRFA